MISKRNLLGLLLTLFTITSFSQNQVWFFGSTLNGPPWEFSSFGLDFTSFVNGTAPGPIQRNNESAIKYYESVSVVSDENGKVLYYTDGIDVFDSSHANIAVSNPADAGDLTGTQHGSTASSVQGAFSILKPGSLTEYYLFTSSSIESSNGLRVNRIDMSKPGNGSVGSPLGELVSKDSLISTTASEMMTAFGVCGSDSVWVISHQPSSYNFVKVLITSNGIQSVDIQNVPTPNTGNSGYLGAAIGRGSMDINKDGTQLVFTGQSPIGTHLLDFNKSTGVLTANPGHEIKGPDGFSYYGYGSEFSPDGSKIYFSSNLLTSGIWQYEISSGDANVVSGSNTIKHGEIITGVDDKLYVGKPNQSGLFTIGVIDVPNAKAGGGGVSYDPDKIDFGAVSGGEAVSYAMPQGYFCPLNPECEIDSVFEVCSTDAPFQFTANMDGIWGGGDYINPTGIFTPVDAGVGNHWVTFDGGCSEPDSVQILVVTCCPNIDPNLGADISVCDNTTYTLDAGSGFKTYEWIKNGLILIDETASTISADSGTYTVNVTNDDDCPGTSTIEISTTASPTPKITGDNFYCAGGSVTLNAGADYDFYTWSPGGGDEREKVVNSSGTYKVLVENSDGCVGIDSITIIERSLPSPVIDGDNIVCENGTIDISGSAGSGGTLIWSDLGSFSTPRSISSLGTYWLIEEDANGCIDSVSHIVTQKDAPSISITPPSASCSNDLPESLIATPSGGEWFINDVSIATGFLNPDSLGNGIHEIKYQVTVDGCLGADSIVHTINSAPEITNMPSISFLCSSEAPITLTADPLGGQWYVNGVAVTDDEFDPGALGLEDHNVKYVVSNGACSDSDSITISVNDAPNVVIDPIVSSCDNHELEILNAAPEGGQWYINNILSSNQFDPSTLGGDIYNVKYVFSNENGCSDSDSVSVTINLAPEIDLGPSTFFCSGDSLSLNAGPGFSDYEWSTGDSDQVVYVDFPGPVSVVVTDANGCIDSSSIQVSANSLPSVDLGGSVVVCEQDSITLGAVHSDAFSYTWLPGNESDATIKVGSENATYTVTIVDNDGCEFTDSVQISEENLPTVSLGPDTIICDNVTKILDAASSSDVAYAWYLDGVIIPDENAQTLEADSGEYIVIVSSANGCESSDTINIDNHQLPNVIIENEYEFCKFDSVEVDLGAIAESYLWTTGDTTSSIWVYSEGVISVDVTDSNSCVVSVSTTLIENAPPALDLGGDDSACVGLEINLDAEPLVGFAPYTYVWSDGQTDPIYNLVGPDTLSVIVTDSNNCMAYDTIGIAALDSLEMSFEDGDNQVCQGSESESPLDAGSFDGASYTWLLPDGTTETTQEIVPLLNGWYTINVTDQYNCKGYDSVFNVVIPTPNIDLGPDTSFCSLGSDTYTIRMEFFENVLGTISWNDNNNNSNDSLFTARYTPTTVIGTFVDTATGCIHVDSVELTEFCEPTLIQFPNVFVPGSDDGNETFRPIGIIDGNFKDYVNNIVWSDFEVFNRWGLKVFQSSDVLPNWDGFYENRPVASGVYYWVYRYKDSSLKEYTFNGFTQAIQTRD
ncbi:gliding motility-associated C-terminal domain-containing protein [Flavobacteriales bacterium]|nr:gliding motility-associated C-terminal domain-containing protein [Flavobacteriales bacterium]